MSRMNNNHDVNIIGTHLENDFIDTLKKTNNLHPGLNTKIPQKVIQNSRKLKNAPFFFRKYRHI